jgi:hypothetical protein
MIFILVLLWAQSAGALPLVSQSAPASPSTTTVNYQGRLADSGGTPVDGQVTLQFALYPTDVDPTPFWGPETHPNVPVSDGLISVILGSQLGGIPQNILGGDLWLEIIVEGETLNPRERLGSVPYAMQAMTVPDGAIHGRNIAPSVFSLFTSGETPVDGLTEILSMDVDFPLDATYLIFARLSTRHNSTGRIISSMRDENGVGIAGSTMHTYHAVSGNGGTQTGFITTIQNFSAGTHTIRLFADGQGAVRSGHIMVVPFAQAP